jgi:hypothetical protein
MKNHMLLYHKQFSVPVHRDPKADTFENMFGTSGKKGMKQDNRNLPQFLSIYLLMDT